MSECELIILLEREREREREICEKKLSDTRCNVQRNMHASRENEALVLLLVSA